MLWVAYLTAIGYGIDEAVWINVDETPIPYHVGGRHGWKKQKPVQALREKMVERATLQLQRSHCTLVASIASREEVQKVLPQVLLPKMTGKKKKAGDVNGTPPIASKHPHHLRHEWVDGPENLQTVSDFNQGGSETSASVQDCTGDGLSPNTLLVENSLNGTSLEMEGFAHS